MSDQPADDVPHFRCKGTGAPVNIGQTCSCRGTGKAIKAFERQMLKGQHVPHCHDYHEYSIYRYVLVVYGVPDDTRIAANVEEVLRHCLDRTVFDTCAALASVLTLHRALFVLLRAADLEHCGHLHTPG